MKVTPKARLPFDKIIYPNLAEWMRENGCTYESLSRQCNIPHSTLFYNLTGAAEIKIGSICAILAVTGLPFEKAFYRDEVVMDKIRT